MKKWIKQNSPWLITSLCTLISLILWIVFRDHPNATSLFINLLAGFFVSTFTICIIERILKKQREQDMLPILLAQYRDIQIFTSRIISLWDEMYIESTDRIGKRPINDLFTQNTLSHIYTNLDLELSPKVTPSQNWYHYIDWNNKEITEMGEKILDRYNNSAEPELLQTVHHLLFDSSIIGKRLKMITITRNLDLQNGFLRLPIMQCCCTFPDDRDLDEINKLILWCNSKYSILEGQSTTIYRIEQEFGVDEPDYRPSSIISEEKRKERHFTSVYVGYGKPPRTARVGD